MITEDNNNKSEQIIDEASIIPTNFSWRAGIGQEIPSTTLGVPISGHPASVFNPFDTGFKPGNSWNVPNVMSPEDVIKNGQTNKEQVSFDISLIPEIELHTINIVQSYKGKPATNEMWLEMKRKLREYYLTVVKKYTNNITAKTLERLYNACLHDYTTEWVMICGNNNVNNVSGTEYICNQNGEYLINPFVVYSLFSGILSPAGNVSINEKMICD